MVLSYRNSQISPSKFMVFFFVHTLPHFAITHQYSMWPNTSRNSMPHFA